MSHLLPQQSLIPVKALALTPEQVNQLIHRLPDASTGQSLISINGKPYLVYSEVHPAIDSAPPAPSQIVIQHYENSFNQESFNASTSAFVNREDSRFNLGCQLLAAGFVCIAVLIVSATLLYNAPDRTISSPLHTHRSSH